MLSIAKVLCLSGLNSTPVCTPIPETYVALQKGCGAPFANPRGQIALGEGCSPRQILLVQIAHVRDTGYGVLYPMSSSPCPPMHKLPREGTVVGIEDHPPPGLGVSFLPQNLLHSLISLHVLGSPILCDRPDGLRHKRIYVGRTRSCSVASHFLGLLSGGI